MRLSDLRPECRQVEIAKRRLKREENLRIANIASQFKSAIMRQRDVDAVQPIKQENA